MFYWSILEGSPLQRSKMEAIWNSICKYTPMLFGSWRPYPVIVLNTLYFYHMLHVRPPEKQRHHPWSNLCYPKCKHIAHHPCASLVGCRSRIGRPQTPDLNLGGKKKRQTIYGSITKKAFTFKNLAHLFPSKISTSIKRSIYVPEIAVVRRWPLGKSCANLNCTQFSWTCSLVPIGKENEPSLKPKPFHTISTN